MLPNTQCELFTFVDTYLLPNRHYLISFYRLHLQLCFYARKQNQGKLDWRGPLLRIIKERTSALEEI